MNTKLFSAAAVTLALVPLQGHAQTYTDNAANAAYSAGYDGQGGSTPGFGAFSVVTMTNANVPGATPTAYAGTFIGSAAHTEDSNEGALDTNGNSFGLYANGASAGTDDPSVTISRTFAIPSESAGLSAVGDSFSLDFVTGYNDDGIAGVALTSAGGAVGSFVYQSGGAGFLFNGASTGQGYASGILHLVYDVTSATTYSLTSTGAVSYTGTGTFSSPFTGFQVQQTNTSPTGGGDHDGFFNNLSVTSVPAAVPEASSSLGLGIMLALGCLTLAARKRSVKA